MAPADGWPIMVSAPNMKRAALYTALLLPALALAAGAVLPAYDRAFHSPIFHFYIVTFATFAAVVVSLFVIISIGETALPRHWLLAFAYLWMGAVFLVHGASTQGALIDFFHPAIVWSAWLTLFGGGLIFLVAGLAPGRPSPAFIRSAAAVIGVTYAAYLAVALLRADLLATALAWPITPAVSDLVFGATVIVWAGAALSHWRNHRQSRNFIDGLAAFESGWYATATVSLFRFPLWNATWWLYHVLLLLGFGLTIFALWRAYEQIRAFRLLRYYAAAGLIVTAGLALFSVHVYSHSVLDNLVAQLERTSRAVDEGIASELAAGLPSVETSADLRAARGRAAAGRLDPMLTGLEALHAALLLDSEGRLVLQAWPPDPYGYALDESGQLAAADELAPVLNGQAVFTLSEPDSPPQGYEHAEGTYFLRVLLPFRPGGDPDARPIGVLATLREAPELGPALITSRRIGLGLAAASLGSLFLILLVIVRRADRLITTRAQELERAYADLRRAEGLRDDLMNMVVHDLRNPLSIINANLGLISKIMASPAQADSLPRFLENARQAGQRMSGLIDDLLNVDKFEAGELRPSLALLSVSNLLINKAEQYQAQAERDEKTLTARVAPDAPLVMADAGLVGRVLDNLLSNAFKYTEPGGRIELLADREGRALRIGVRDNGQGIPAEFQPRLFEKFAQVTDAQGRPLRQGTGLGLAFCRLAVEAHGGRIWVESTPGRGSAFFFTLPLEDGRVSRSRSAP